MTFKEYNNIYGDSILEREYNKPISRNKKDVNIDYESSDTYDLEQWAWDGNEGYSEVAGDIYYVKNKKIYFVKNLRAEYNFKTGKYIINTVKSKDIPEDIKKKLKKSRLKRSGRDMVFYHGTDRDFKKFVNDYEGDNFSMGNYWKGMYFTETPEYAETFGSTIKAVVINSKKPIYVGSNRIEIEEKNWHNSNESNENSFSEYLIKKGYDSIIVMSTKRSQMTEVIVFDPKLIYVIDQG